MPLRILCPDWRDPRNVGSAFRLADAVGVRDLILAGTSPRPPAKLIAKTARSTVRSVPWTGTPSAADYLREMRAAGHLVLALEVTDQSVSLLEYELPRLAGGQDIILVPGTEDSGVAADLLDLCDASVHLPMAGQNTSMNVVVALGAAVYLLLRQFGKE